MYVLYCYLPVHQSSKTNVPYDNYIHNIMDILAPGLRVPNEREYYNMTPKMAASILRQIGGISGNDVVYPITYRRGNGRKLIAYDIEYLLSIYDKVSFEFSPKQEYLIQFVQKEYSNKYLILPARDKRCIDLATSNCIVKHFCLCRNIIVDLDAGKGIAEFEVSNKYYWDEYMQPLTWHEYTGRQFKYFADFHLMYGL